MDHDLSEFTTQPYLNQDMKDELFVVYARREAHRIISHLERYKIASDIERHLKFKFQEDIVGS